MNKCMLTEEAEMKYIYIKLNIMLLTIVMQ